MNNSPLQSFQNLISNVVNTYIVRPTGNNKTTGINGFVFDILDDEEVSIDSDITDHFVEENYTIQDHWAQRPIRVSIKGYVAELTDLFPNTLGVIFQDIQTLNPVLGYIPGFTRQATQVYAKTAGVIARAGQVINQAQNIYSLITGSSTSATKQQSAYDAFFKMWLSRQLCSIETPYGVFEGMAIENIRVLQRGASNMVTDFEINFKQIQVAQTKIIPSLAVLNPIGSGRKLPTSPTINVDKSSNASPVNTPPSQGFGNIDPTKNNVKGRVQEMIPVIDNLGTSQGTNPLPRMNLGGLMPPLAIPGVSSGRIF